MKILVITPHYLPDGGPAAPLFTMLCEALVCRGHQVTVIAAVPHYPSGYVPAEFNRWHVRHTVENGVYVIRVPVPSLKRANLALRLLQFASYQLGVTLVGLRLTYDVLLSCNPALQVGLPFAVLAVLRGRPAIFSVHDLYPEAGVALGIFRHKGVIAAVAALERFCLHHATRVRFLSESFVPGLKALGVPEDKLTLIYDWVDTNLIHPMPRKNSFSQEHNLDNRFVVLYAGNLGLSQGLSTVLESARILANEPEILFLFVGDGAGKQELLSKSSSLNNVRFLRYQPRERLPEVLASADLSLVVLKHGIGSISLPSKLFSILASGRPVVSSLDEGCDAWNLVQRSQAGLCVPPEDSSAMAEAILSLKEDPKRREQMGCNGRLWAEKYHSPQAAAILFESLFQAILKE